MATVALSIPPEAKVDERGVEAFRHCLTGVLVRPGDPGYEAACAVWNGMIHRRPALIAYCASRQDVIEAVYFARKTGILTAIRSGGHNIAGASLCDGGLVIDLSRMNSVTVDSVNRTACAEGGALLADLDVATQTHGLATTTGVNSDTGLIGLTLGGGIGRLGRKHGLSCDNMLSAEVVTADGRVLNASEHENADLFWGLRGGGGNFGIVTAITYRLHPLGPTVLGGSLVYEWKRVRDALRLYAEFSAAAPNALCADAALITMPDGNHGFAISAFYAGSMAEGERVLRPLRQTLMPLADRVGPMSYVQLQKAGDASFPRGHRFYWKAQFLRQITQSAADALIAIVSRPFRPHDRFSYSNRSAEPSPECRRQPLPMRTVRRPMIAFPFRYGAIRPPTKRTSPGRVKCTRSFGPSRWTPCTSIT